MLQVDQDCSDPFSTNSEAATWFAYCSLTMCAKGRGGPKLVELEILLDVLTEVGGVTSLLLGHRHDL